MSEWSDAATSGAEIPAAAASTADVIDGAIVVTAAIWTMSEFGTKPLFRAERQ
jgi:hypothetical protein